MSIGVKPFSWPSIAANQERSLRQTQFGTAESAEFAGCEVRRAKHFKNRRAVGGHYVRLLSADYECSLSMLIP